MKTKLTEKQVKISKTISYALRHRPDAFGLKVDSEGWVELADLLDAVSRRLSSTVNRKDVEDIVAASDKKRFEMDDSRIRATYGHSFESKIEFEPSAPPDVLYHGTSRTAMQRIRTEGLKPMNRQYVHLSSDIETARNVGSRHDGNPVILAVDAKRMNENGYRFFHSANDGTWMCDEVPVEFFAGQR